ncbi:hypothetical protein R3P38DRAFT_2354152, partial [Favolaschia claudopus]
ERLNVEAFLRAIIPTKSYALVFPAAETCFSKSKPTMDIDQTIQHPKTRPLPPIILVKQLIQVVRQATLDGKLSVSDSRFPGTRFSFWIIGTWQWLIEMADAREDWEVGRDWVGRTRGALVAADMAAQPERLSTLGWNAQLMAGEQTLQFSRAISDRMVSDGMMDVMISVLEKRISVVSRLASRIILVPRAFIEILKAERPEDFKEVKRSYLVALERKVKEGGASKLWFTALWEEQIHWLAFKCDFKTLTGAALSYGKYDSMLLLAVLTQNPGDPVNMSGKPRIIIQKTLWWLQGRFN